MAAKYGSLPFKEQIAFYRQKVRIPTRAWTDLWEGMHARAFSVAGAMRGELLTDFQAAIGSAIENGTTLAQFRKDFDQIVAKHGWSYKGGRGWRTRVIYETNLRTSYQAGRYQQMQAAKETRPYWRYRHNDSVANPRPQHQAWDGLVLSADDPFWSTHFPPNGWGCRCFVETLSERDLKKFGKDGPDTAPALNLQEITVGTRGPSPRTVTVPEGIDPGWGYSVGEAAWGRETGARITEQANAPGWVAVDARGPEHFARPQTVPVSPVDIPLAPRARNEDELRQRLRDALGADQVELKDPRGERIVIGDYLVDHILAKPARLDGREQYFPLLPDLVRNPYEIWVGFARHEETGQYALRKRYVKYVQTADKRTVLGLVGDVVNGYWTGLTVFHGGKTNLNKLRVGMLLWGE